MAQGVNWKNQVPGARAQQSQLAGAVCFESFPEICVKEIHVPAPAWHVYANQPGWIEPNSEGSSSQVIGNN